jgi:hypothetical protein
VNIHPVVSMLNGVISIQLEALFLGDEVSPPDTTQDEMDQQYILAYGDPKVNLAGLFTDNSTIPAFQFKFGTPQMMAGITTQMAEVTARFYTVVPPVPLHEFPAHDWHRKHPLSSPEENPPAVRPMDCITADSERAAGVWVTAIQSACAAAMTQLRGMPAPLETLPDDNV